MALQLVRGHKYAQGIHEYTGHYGDVKDRLFVSYKPYLVLLKCMID